MGGKPRLPFLRKTQWRWRWMQGYEKDAGYLHRIKSFRAGGTHAACDREDMFVRGVKGATTVCGLRGTFLMPGLFSRMGAKRCKECCEKLGVPQGRGAPFNDGLNV